MHTIIDEWTPLKDGRYILTLDKQIPSRAFKKYRIDGKDYVPVHVHMPGPYLLKVIALEGEGNFVGKEVEFVN